MPVQHAETLLNKFVGEFLAKRVPEDLMATYSVAQVTYQFETECDEHGPGLSSRVLWQIHIYIDKVDQSDGDYKPYRMTGTVPYDYLSDGDLTFLEKICESMWQDYTFSTMMLDVDGELEQAAKDAEE